MDSFLSTKRHKDLETAMETIIPGLMLKNRNTNSIKSSSGAVSQMLESESMDSSAEKKSRQLL